MYNNLSNLINTHFENKREEIKTRISTNENALERYSTDTRWNSYKRGVLTREKAAELATKRAIKEIDKNEQERLGKLDRAQRVSELQFVEITVEWHKSRTWGNNPRATVRTNDGVFYGSASGCGYDKESAAIAEALNQSGSVLKMLYDKEETKPEDKPRRDYVGYGAGYGILPSFEGGVGVSSHRQIFANCGYTWETVSNGKTFDAYRITKLEV